jgi:hypothetical protein
MRGQHAFSKGEWVECFRVHSSPRLCVVTQVWATSGWVRVSARPEPGEDFITEWKVQASNLKKYMPDAAKEPEQK